MGTPLAGARSPSTDAEDKKPNIEKGAVYTEQVSAVFLGAARNFLVCLLQSSPHISKVIQTVPVSLAFFPIW